MAKRTDESDLLTLAMRRAHAETAERREPKPPSDDEDASAAGITDDQDGAVEKPPT